MSQTKKALTAGPDPDFPYLTEYQRFSFPRPDHTAEGLVAVGCNLSPGMLLSSYEQGIFPWYNPEDPILWQSPDPRFVIFPSTLHVSQSMTKVLKRGDYTITLDRDFPSVIRNCAAIFRPGQNGTWITSDMIDAYVKLHRLGWAHSAEAWADGELAGGCYGIRLGAAFFGESMFAKKPNASKAAFLTLARILFEDETAFIDCQMPTEHLRSLGGREISRRSFLELLKDAMIDREIDPDADGQGNWGTRYGSGPTHQF